MAGIVIAIAMMQTTMPCCRHSTGYRRARTLRSFVRSLSLFDIMCCISIIVDPMMPVSSAHRNKWDETRSRKKLANRKKPAKASLTEIFYRPCQCLLS